MASLSTSNILEASLFAYLYSYTRFCASINSLNKVESCSILLLSKAVILFASNNGKLLSCLATREAQSWSSENFNIGPSRRCRDSTSCFSKCSSYAYKPRFLLFRYTGTKLYLVVSTSSFSKILCASHSSIKYRASGVCIENTFIPFHTAFFLSLILNDHLSPLK